MSEEKVPVLVFGTGDLLYIDCENPPMKYHSIDLDLIDTGECPICYEVMDTINEVEELVKTTIPVTNAELQPDGTYLDVIIPNASRVAYLRRKTGGDWHCETCDTNWSKIETDDAVEKLRKIRQWEKV